MKSNGLPKNFPASPEDWDKLIAHAPAHVDDPESPYDPNDPLAVEAFFKNTVVSRSLPELRQKLVMRRRGPSRAPLKVPTTIRFDADVLVALKASGKGWQTRVNEAMREWVKSHSPT